MMETSTTSVSTTMEPAVPGQGPGLLGVRIAEAAVPLHMTVGSGMGSGMGTGMIMAVVVLVLVLAGMGTVEVEEVVGSIAGRG